MYALLLVISMCLAFFFVKPVWPKHIHYVVYRKRFPKCIRGIYTAALNRFEIALKAIWTASVNGAVVTPRRCLHLLVQICWYKPVKTPTVTPSCWPSLLHSHCTIRQGSIFPSQSHASFDLKLWLNGVPFAELFCTFIGASQPKTVDDL